MSDTSRLMRTHRPMAVQALNRAASLLERTGLLKLEAREEALLDAARKKAGGRDFEDTGFLEPLGYLLDSLSARLG